MNDKVSLMGLKLALERSWNEDTAVGEWSHDCVSMNQCAVTALVVQDYFGGELLRCEMTDGDSHYWNELPDCSEADLTSEQFDFIEPQPLKETKEIRTREYVLSYPETVKRYEILSNRVYDYLF